jgi:hypothetical protein
MQKNLKINKLFSVTSKAIIDIDFKKAAHWKSNTGQPPHRQACYQVSYAS